MEPVSAGASVLAFIGVALQSTKTLCQTISSFKNASQEIKSLISAVENLRMILTQLKGCRVLNEPGTDLQNVTNLVNACNQDICRYESELKKFKVDPIDTKVNQAWKIMKAFVGEKDLQRIWRGLNHHCEVLGVQLNLLQSNTTFACKDQLLRLNNTFSRLATEDGKQSMLLSQQSTDLSNINTNLDNLKTSITNQIQDAIMTITQRTQVPEQSTVPQIRSEDIYNLIKLLQDKVSGLPDQLTSIQNSLEHTNSTNHPTEKSMLADSIQRLCQLVMKDSGTIRHKEAEAIINDVATILNSASEHTGTFTSGKKRMRELNDEDISEPEMKRLCNLLTISHSVDINQGPRRTSFTNGKVIQKHKSKENEIEGCKTIVRVTEKKFMDMENGQRMDELQTTIITAKIKAFLQHSELPAVLVAHLHRTLLPCGFSSINPVISIGKMLPDDSPIFSIVRTGNVEEIQRLISQRECTLRDRDSYGTPLLHYAMEQPRMCKFLIDNGADIDELSPDPGCREFPVTPLACEVNDAEETNECINRRVVCRRLLLHAGADPTLGIYHAEVCDSALESAVSGGTVESLRDMLKYGKPIIDLEERYEGGHTLLIQLAFNFLNGYDPFKFDLLLKSGANIHARDDQGHTCLHICIREARFKSSQEFESLICLIEGGADICSIDHFGHSISDDAYRPLRHDEDYELGGYRGDLWDAVLSQCGYDICKMREGYHRRPQYIDGYGRKGYSRKDFERLWSGREKFCPYFNDPPIWCPRGCSLSSDTQGKEIEDEEICKLVVEDEDENEDDYTEDEDENEDDYAEDGIYCSVVSSS